ncbi:MAG: TetR/AcrR family transcriptional regulator [Acidimicrobiales bacterium]|nr:TetR/AcrR family transcriptional regulator [Acidimicrobiales bacterium]MCB9394980.1 TetR/AcrR family transcriptional regulator [Acidimicrobiaceae bacterium]
MPRVPTSVAGSTMTADPAEPAPTSAGAPLTPKGRRTRAKLLAAAREVFCERQYLDTSISEIAERAGVAHGTFYTYFESKQDVFREVTLEFQRELLEARDRAAAIEEGTLLERVERTNRTYLEAYRDNAQLWAVIEQVATFNDELRTIRRDMRDAFVVRSEKAIRSFQRQGLALNDVDAHYAASALGSMIDRFAYVWLVLGEPADLDESVRILTLLWARALGIEAPAGSLKRRRKGTQRPT